MDLSQLVLAFIIWVAALVGLFLIVFGILAAGFAGTSIFEGWIVPAGISLCVVAALLVWVGHGRSRAQSRDR